MASKPKPQSTSTTTPPIKQPSSTERVAKLEMLLMSDNRYRTRQEICQETNLYGKDWDNENTRRKFYRDLEEIRESGVRITQKANDDSEAQFLIKQEDAELTELDQLTEAERITLLFVSASVNLNQDWDVTAVSKLIAATGNGNGDITDSNPLAGPSPWVVNLQPTKLLTQLAAAAAQCCEVTFSYGNKMRVVKPLETLTQSGWSYLAALDGETKVFRIDRIEGEITVGKPGSFEPQEPVNWEEQLPADPVLLSFEQEQICVLAVDSQLAAQAEQTRGEVLKRNEDGSIELAVTVRNSRALQMWLYELGDHAKILSPPEFIEDLQLSLVYLIDPAATDGKSNANPPPPQRKAKSGKAGAKSAKAKQAKRTSGDERALIFAIVPWAYRRDYTTIADVMKRFGLTKEEALPLLYSASAFELLTPSGFVQFGFALLAEDLSDDADLETLDPSEIIVDFFSPDVLLKAPLKLSIQEAAGLLLVGEAAMNVPGADRDGALASGLAKVREQFGNKLKLSANLEKSHWIDELGEAIKAKRRLNMRYDSHSQGKMLELKVNPLRIVNHYGHWYLLASPVETPDEAPVETDSTVCKARDPVIHIHRMSRIDKLEETNEEFKSSFSDDELTFENAKQYDETQRVVLSIPKQDLRVVERYPAESLEEELGEEPDDDDRVMAEYRIRSAEILGVMLMKLGEGTYIMNTAELPDNFVSAGADAAKRILDQYS